MMPNEKPIIFSAPMVRAILEGRKTQTRRVVKFASNAAGHNQDGCNTVRGNKIMRVPWTPDTLRATIKCPYPVGTRLWVRETFGFVGYIIDDNDNMVDWAPDRPALAINEKRFGKGYQSGYVIYAADGNFVWGDPDDPFVEKSQWKPPIHMPRWASRITLEVTDVRVERVQDISKEDVIAEGIEGLEDVHSGWYQPYAELWNSIHAKPKPVYSTDGDGVRRVVEYVSYLWEDVQEVLEFRGKPCRVCGNPWVWAYTFKRVEAPHAD